MKQQELELIEELAAYAHRAWRLLKVMAALHKRTMWEEIERIIREDFGRQFPNGTSATDG